MNTNRGKMFLQRDFAFYDSCVVSVLGHQIFYLYEMLRRYTWRTDTSGIKQMRKLKREGFLAARTCQQTLAENAGILRQNASPYFQKMKALGWIKVIPAEKFGSSIYLLGEVVTDSQGHKHEVFYADAWLATLWDMLVNAAFREFGNPAPNYTDGFGEEPSSDSLPDVGSEHKLVTMLEPSERIEKILAWMEHFYPGVIPGGHTTSPERDTPCLKNQICLPTQTASDSQLRQRATPNPDTLIEKKEEEKKEEEKERGSLRSPPPSLGFGDSEQSGKSIEVEKVPLMSGKFKGEEPSGPTVPPLGFDCLDGGEEAEEEDGLDGAGPERGHGGVFGSGAGATPPGGRTKALEAIVEAAKAKTRAARDKAMEKSRAKERAVQNLGGKPVKVSERDSMRRMEEEFREGMEKAFPGVAFAAWGPKERGQIRQLTEKYSCQIIEHALQYLVRQWLRIQERFLKGHGSLPSLGLLLRFHEVLVPESQMWAMLIQIHDEWKAYFRENPGALICPPELEKKYRAHQKEFEALGIK